MQQGMHKKKQMTSRTKVIRRNSGASTPRTSAELSQAKPLLWQLDVVDFAIGTASSICMGKNMARSFLIASLLFLSLVANGGRNEKTVMYTFIYMANAKPF